MNRVQCASESVGEAIELLRRAKNQLLLARNEQHIPVALQLAALEEIHDILEDPECTPEILESRDE